METDNLKALPCFIDFEASSLSSTSYPIEVGFSDEEGFIQSYLISPSDIDEWNDWDVFAEGLHGISREQLQDEGLPPSEVAAILNEQLEGQMYCNGYDFDFFWCKRLFEASDISKTFILADANHLFIKFIKENYPTGLSDVMTNSKISDEKVNLVLNEILLNSWDKLGCKRHRAACDVEQMIKTWSELQNLNQHSY